MTTHTDSEGAPASRADVEPGRAAPFAASDGTRALIGTALAMMLAIAGVLIMHALNPRLLPSWHGFLHSAIASRFPAAGLPPENPFFAGEPLPYYWFYHLVGHYVQRLLGTDPLHAFRMIALFSLALLIGAAVAIGHRRFASLPAGLAIALLAVVGGNPLGFATAVAKHAAGHPLLDPQPAVVDQVLVDNFLADRLMTHPLLAALHFTGDWRYGQNLPWFFDISSRTPALALVIVFLFLWLGRARAANLLGLTIVSGIMTALNPLIGLALVAAMAAAQLPVALSALRADGFAGAVRASARPAAALAGAALALPAFYHMLLLEGTAGPSTPRLVVLKSVLAASVFVLLAPAALLGIRSTPRPTVTQLRTIALAGGLLIVLLIAVNLEEGNEHNLSNLAQCVLAVPAAATLAWRRAFQAGRGWPALVGFALLCTPTAASTLAAFSGRPAAPLTFGDGRLQRVPVDGALQRGYDWIRTSTPVEAVLVTDPRRPLKMANNVSEIPAFTGRVLFVDQPSYLVTPHAEAALRTAIATALVDGLPLAADDVAYLIALGRPLYLVVYDVDTVVDERLRVLWGAPRFDVPPFAVYELRLPFDRATEVSADGAGVARRPSGR